MRIYQPWATTKMKEEKAKEMHWIQLKLEVDPRTRRSWSRRRRNWCVDLSGERWRKWTRGEKVGESKDRLRSLRFEIERERNARNIFEEQQN